MGQAACGVLYKLIEPVTIAQDLNDGMELIKIYKTEWKILC